METSEFCIYTIVRGDKLAAAERSGDLFPYTEKTKRVTGLELWLQSQEEEKKMLVIFADATDCSSLVYWGVLKGVSVQDDRTEYTVERVIALPGEHKPQDLVLRSAGKTIAQDFIRPYAVCYTPAFIKE